MGSSTYEYIGKTYDCLSISADIVVHEEGDLGIKRDVCPTDRLGPLIDFWPPAAGLFFFFSAYEDQV